MKKIDAIKYLVKHSVYNDEWSGAGMWEAVIKVMENKNEDNLTEEFIKGLLEKADKF